MVSDPAGYFVVFPDQAKRRLMLEHYRNDGVLDVVVEGASAAEVYLPAIELTLVSRLDHAAYLGRELARTERSLRTGESYVQDAAPELGASLRVANESSTETPACACGALCGEHKP